MAIGGTSTRPVNITWEIGPPAPLQRGDRVRIREGYLNAGVVAFYLGKSESDADMVWVEYYGQRMSAEPILAAAIEPYLLREQRIEWAIEDYVGTSTDVEVIDSERTQDSWDNSALLFAILDAGV